LVSDIEGETKTGCARRIFGARRYKITGGRRKLNNEELHNLALLA
jgi:hypothetical protein